MGVSLFSTRSRAANLELAGINLGSTSFFDGFGRNEEGFTYLAYLQYATSRSLKQDTGKDSPYFVHPKIDVFVMVNQLAYTLPEKLFNDTAHLGINFILPVVAFNTKFDAPSATSPVAVQLDDNNVGVGDLTFGPFMQFRPMISSGRPVFSQRVEFDVIAPIGKFNPNKDINQSSNFTSLNPYWAGTVLPLPHLELSARLNFLYNFATSRPALERLYALQNPPRVKDAQAGQAAWLNFAASYEPIHTLHIGANGYYFMQFNLDLYEMQDGSSNQGMWANGDTGKASFLGIGPGLMWEATPQNKLFANVYFQMMVRNRAQSDVVNLRWVHSF